MNNDQTKSIPQGISLPEIIPLRPLVLMSGFLGAGKTTFLRATLQELAQHQINSYVILNERENARIDSETLRDFATAVAPLISDCVCCDSFYQLYEMLLDAAKQDSDIIFVELNGTADPLPIMEVFTISQSKFMLQPRWQVCVIDALMFARRINYNQLEQLQLESASHFHLSRTAGLSEEQIRKLTSEVRSINPHASAVSPSELAISICEVISTASRKTIGSLDSLNSKIPLSMHKNHHLAHMFTGCQILLPDHPIPAERVITWLRLLPLNAIRAKILLTVTDDITQRMLFERVGIDVCEKPIAVPIRDKLNPSAVIIGPDLDPSQLLDLAQTHLDSDCQLA